MAKKIEKAPAAALLRYALTSARTTLGDGDEDVIVTEGDIVTFTCKEVLYATLQVDGNDLVITFLQPQDISEMESKLTYYKAAEQVGWLEFRTPLSRDPRPWLEADFGNIIGQTMYEILHNKHINAQDSQDNLNQADQLKTAHNNKPRIETRTEAHQQKLLGSIYSAGGPYIVLTATAANVWKGYDDIATYDSIAFGCDDGKITNFAGHTVLILGTPDSLYYMPLKDGGVFARIVSFDAADDNVLAQHLNLIPKHGWSPIEGVLTVTDEPLLAFDAAIPGDDIGGDALSIDLPPGYYTASYISFFPDDGTELLLTRIQK